MWGKIKRFWTRHTYRLRRYYWALWSHVYRWLFHRAWRDRLIDTCANEEEAWKQVKVLTWTEDGAKEMNDACGSAGWVQHCISEVNAGREQPEGALDCDDFAAWCIEAVDPEYAAMDIFVMSWVGRYNEVQGHAMARGITKAGVMFHVGNWGVIGPARNLRDLILLTMKRAQAKELVAWGVLSKNLFPKKIGFEVPSSTLQVD